MLVAIDIVLAGDPLGLEAARDLRRDVRRTYPELVQAAPDSCSAGPAIKTVTVFNGHRLARAEYNFTHVSVK
jgi:hypothetical protein